MPKDPNATQTWPNSDGDWANSSDGYRQDNEDRPDEEPGCDAEAWDELGFDTFVWDETEGRYVEAGT